MTVSALSAARTLCELRDWIGGALKNFRKHDT